MSKQTSRACIELALALEAMMNDVVSQLSKQIVDGRFVEDAAMTKISESEEKE